MRWHTLIHNSWWHCQWAFPFVGLHVTLNSQSPVKSHSLSNKSSTIQWGPTHSMLTIGTFDSYLRSHQFQNNGLSCILQLRVFMDVFPIERHRRETTGYNCPELEISHPVPRGTGINNIFQMIQTPKRRTSNGSKTSGSLWLTSFLW